METTEPTGKGIDDCSVVKIVLHFRQVMLFFRLDLMTSGRTEYSRHAIKSRKIQETLQTILWND